MHGAGGGASIGNRNARKHSRYTREAGSFAKRPGRSLDFYRREVRQPPSTGFTLSPITGHRRLSDGHRLLGTGYEVTAEAAVDAAERRYAAWRDSKPAI